VTLSRRFLPTSTLILLLCLAGLAFAQAPADKDKSAERTAAAEKTPDKPDFPFQIKLLETHIRFETNGDSRKEVHTVVVMNNLLGVRQFGRLLFDYNRAYQQVEIPMVRVTHANGGTSEVLPSAVTDAPNPAVENYQAYQDVRVKSVRILGLQEGDTVEYRVITTTTKQPLAPNFWLEHTFDRSGQVLEEKYELELPKAVKPKINPETPAKSSVDDPGQTATHQSYFWEYKSSGKNLNPSKNEELPDVVVTSFSSWEGLSRLLAGMLQPSNTETGKWEIAPEVKKKAAELVVGAPGCRDRLEAIYRFVSENITTVDLPLGSGEFQTRPGAEILSSGYATPEDKYKLFAAMALSYALPPFAILAGATQGAENQLPRPSIFTHLLIGAGCDRPKSAKHSSKPDEYWLDPSLEVAPFGMISLSLRGKKAFTLDIFPPGDIPVEPWQTVPASLPFPANQKVTVAANISDEGNLGAKVKYIMRGDNELLLRVAFHQTAKDKWKDVAGLLAISDGFRGQVTSATASDPKDTKAPFTVEYELTQPKFVDWSKKPVRIPPLLPQIGLPDPPGRGSGGSTGSKIELGTPLDVQTSLTLRLPTGTTVLPPPGTTADRDYATFSSKYSSLKNVLTVSRHVDFKWREISADRAADYNAFLRAVQGDQAQTITLERDAVPAPAKTEH
jgi:Domain of Unknown Function with PDB structure (DUF3857)